MNFAVCMPFECTPFGRKQTNPDQLSEPTFVGSTPAFSHGTPGHEMDAS